MLQELQSEEAVLLGLREAAPVCLPVWREKPCRLASLWDIVKRFKVAEFSMLLDRIASVEHSTMMLSSSGKGNVIEPRFIEALKNLAIEAKELCGQVGFKDAYGSAGILRSKLEEQTRLNVSHLETEARHLKESLVREAFNRSFVMTKKERAEFVDNAAFFGDEVKKNFPGASADIREVGNCLAMEFPTAAVFHLMRVAEYGLRALAKKLRVRLTHAGLRHPVEFADWEKVITGIKNEISKARALGPGPKRQTKLEIFSDAADHCVYMKDIWRNNVSHARSPYNDTEAIAVLERVREFMMLLATKLLGARV